ncbi:hypothetical protein, partial [Bradyrhizobium sp. P5_C11_2]
MTSNAEDCTRMGRESRESRETIAKTRAGFARGFRGLNATAWLPDAGLVLHRAIAAGWVPWMSISFGARMRMEFRPMPNVIRITSGHLNLPYA